MIALPIRGRDGQARLARGLLRSAAAAGLEMTVEAASSRPWASATFAGTQAFLVLHAPRAPALGRWVADLPLAELDMPGHLLASIAVERIEDDGATVRVELTALVIERD